MVAIFVLLAFLSTASADTLDWRDCTPHSAEESAEYLIWLQAQGLPETEAVYLANSYEAGDIGWSETPCHSDDPQKHAARE